MLHCAATWVWSGSRRGAGRRCSRVWRRNAQRYRVGLETSYTTRWSNGATLTPFVEVAGRRDDGDGEVGNGVEVAGGVRLAHPGSGFGLEARGRVLALHAAAGYREHGFGVTARLTPGGTDGRGLSVALTPGWGSPVGGADALWREQAFGGVGVGAFAGDGASMDARVGYGFAMRAGQVVTPFGEVGVYGAEHRRLRAGVRLGRAAREVAPLHLELAGERNENRLGVCRPPVEGHRHPELLVMEPQHVVPLQPDSADVSLGFQTVAATRPTGVWSSSTRATSKHERPQVTAKRYWAKPNQETICRQLEPQPEGHLTSAMTPNLHSLTYTTHDVKAGGPEPGTTHDHVRYASERESPPDQDRLRHEHRALRQHRLYQRPSRHWGDAMSCVMRRIDARDTDARRARRGHGGAGRHTTQC